MPSLEARRGVLQGSPAPSVGNIIKHLSTLGFLDWDQLGPVAGSRESIKMRVRWEIQRWEREGGPKPPAASDPLEQDNGKWKAAIGKKHAQQKNMRKQRAAIMIRFDLIGT
jgi:hypothetical protein